MMGASEGLIDVRLHNLFLVKYQRLRNRLQSVIVLRREPEKFPESRQMATDQSHYLGLLAARCAVTSNKRRTIGKRRSWSFIPLSTSVGVLPAGDLS